MSPNSPWPYSAGRLLPAPAVSALCGMGYISNTARDKSNAIGYFEQALSVDGKCAFAADALKVGTTRSVPPDHHCCEVVPTNSMTPLPATA